LRRDVRWGKFKLAYDKNSNKGLFDVFNTNSILSRDIIENSGDIPYLTASKKNNAVSTYISLDEKLIEKGNSIFIGGKTFVVTYQKKDYFSNDSHNLALHLRDETHRNKRIYLFLATSIYVGLRNKYSWEGSISKAKAKTDFIWLPQKTDNVLDFEYMEAYIAYIENQHIMNLENNRKNLSKTYLGVAGLNNYSISSDDKKILMHKPKWGSFEIDNLFHIITGGDVIISRTKSGNIPLISHQHKNNGIAKTIIPLKNRVLLKAEETIALADRGVFYATCQKNDFYIGTRVKALVFKDGEKSENVRLFLVSAMNKLQPMFDEYANNATDKLPKLKIQLPKINKVPDYNYMNSYIKVQKKFAIIDVMNDYDLRIEAMKHIINENNH